MASSVKLPKLENPVRVEFLLWKTRFDDYCVLQGYRDLTRSPDLPTHYIEEKRPLELASFRSALSNSVLNVVQYSIAPQLTEEEKSQPWMYVEALRKYCVGEDTVIADRFDFLELRQGVHEDINTWENKVRRAAGELEYGILTEQIMRDKFLHGLNCKEIRKELLRLKHKKDSGAITSFTEVVRHAKALESATDVDQKLSIVTEEQVHKVEKGKLSSKSSFHPFKCYRCGGATPHNPSGTECPANKPGVICHNCYGYKHFSKVCKNEKDKFKGRWLRENKETESAVGSVDDTLTLTDIGSVTASRKLFSNLSLSAKGDVFISVSVQLDTGASCNTIPVSLVKKMKAQIVKSSTVLRAYSGNVIKPLGKVTFVCDNNGAFHTLEFEVIPDMSGRKPLLGCHDAQRLHLITVDDRKVSSDVSSVSSTPQANSGLLTIDTVLHEYEENFKGLGDFGQPVSFTLSDHVQPIHAPIHRLPVGKRDAVKQKLDEMVKEGK